MKNKIMDILGYLLFLLLMIVISPILFLSGGLARIIRFYGYTKARVHETKPHTYYY